MQLVGGLKGGSGENQRKIALKVTPEPPGALPTGGEQSSGAGPWPTSERLMCLKADEMAVRKPATKFGASYLSQMRKEVTLLTEEKGLSFWSCIDIPLISIFNCFTWSLNDWKGIHNKVSY